MKLRLPESPRKHALIALLAGVGVAALFCVLAFTKLNPVVAERRHLESIVGHGMPEAQVRERLGAPSKEYSATNAPEHYYVRGWSYRQRPITNKVLIYERGEPICYVWIDRNGTVEDVYVGGT
jgi:hypothetical protein